MTRGITLEMAITALVNLHHSIRGEDCPREAAVGCATAAVQQLKHERDELRAALEKIAGDDLDIAGDSYEGHFYEHKEIAAGALKR